MKLFSKLKIQTFEKKDLKIKINNGFIYLQKSLKLFKV